MTATETHSAHPLDWPLSRPRTPKDRRKYSLFKQSLDSARKKLFNELGIFNASAIVLSTNIVLRGDGMPSGSYTKEPDDPGAAVWFRRKGKPYVLACDTYTHAWENVYALARVIECLRQMERDGSPGLMEQAFTGFTALPPALVTPPPPEWWEVLGVQPHAPTNEVLAAFEAKTLLHHPDRNGGSSDMQARINVARDAFRRERGL